ncbi:MAG: hypothetical protein OS112_01250 [Methanoregula sp.]|nr:MAG: hypothetical protein OS112_01250 [Methanoregula sp.]
MDNGKTPCCAADSLRRIRKVQINGIMTGLTMLDECIAEVKTQRLQNEAEIRSALLKRVKVFNYIPPNVEDEYARVILEEFHNHGAGT